MIPLRFSQFHILLFLLTKVTLTGLFLFTFETTQWKNHFDTNLIKVHSAIIEILSFSCFVIFLVMADGSHLGMPYCKKLNWCHARYIVARSWYDSTMIFSVSHFAIFVSNGSHPDWSIFI